MPASQQPPAFCLSHCVLGCALLLQHLLALVLSGKESGVLVSNAVLLFARLVLQHQQAFEQLLGSAAAAGIHPQQQQQQAGGSSPGVLLLAVVGVLCDAFDSIAQPLARKLAACGLAALLAFPVEVGSSTVGCGCLRLWSFDDGSKLVIMLVCQQYVCRYMPCIMASLHEQLGVQVTTRLSLPEDACCILVQGILQQLPPMLSYITSVYGELEATGADDPTSDRCACAE